MSSDKGMHWSRPATKETDDNYSIPIPILTGRTSPVIISDIDNNRMHLFVYNNIFCNLLIANKKTANIKTVWKL